MSPLRLEQVGFNDILKDINISLNQGETYCLLGYNGSGKSLLLKIATGLLMPTQGQVFYQDKSLYESLRYTKLKMMERTGFLFQNAALISNMNVFDNVALVLRYHSRLKEKEIKEKVDFFLEKLRLYKKAPLMPSDLSTGEKKLVSFARAIVNDPDILILDEPTALIDKKTKRVLLDIIEEAKEKEKKTIFMTSSDTELIFNISDLVGVIMDGSIKVQGEPYEIKYSDQKEIKELLSSIKIIKENQIENEILSLIK